MSEDQSDPQKAEGNRDGKNDHRASTGSERRQPKKDTRFQKGRSGNSRGRPPKKIEAREHDNPAMHNLMKRMTVTAVNGKVLEGRVYDLICQKLAIMALHGNLKALKELIELAGGYVAVTIMFMELYDSERSRDEEPDPDEGGQGPRSPGGGQAAAEDAKDDAASPEPDEEEDGASAAGTRPLLPGRGDTVDPNDESNLTNHKAVRDKLAGQRSAARQDRASEVAPEQKTAGSSEQDRKPWVDDFEAIQRWLMSPNYVSRHSHLPPDCLSPPPGVRSVRPRRGSIDYMEEQQLRKAMNPPGTADVAGGELPSSPKVDDHDQHSSYSPDGEVSVPTGNDSKGGNIII